jgi:hypothetical protein
MRLKTPSQVYYLAYCTRCGAVFYPSLSSARHVTKNRAFIAACACGASGDGIGVAKYVLAKSTALAPKRRAKPKGAP